MSWLKRRAEEEAANAWCGSKAYGALQKGLLSPTDERVVARLANAIEAVAREFADRALRDPISEWNSISCGDQNSCDKLVARAIAEADKDEP